MERSSRSTAALLALSLAVSACSSDEPSSLRTGDAVDTGVGAVSTTDPVAVAVIDSTGADAASAGRELTDEIDALAFADVASTTTEPDSTSVPPTMQGPSSGGDGKPVTTIAGGGGGIDPDTVYQGVLGALGPDDVVASAVVAPPVAAPGVHPLTGQTGAVVDRPAIVVKVDNGMKARPQTGLNKADIVVEEEVEGGITRFAAIFQSQTTVIGPVRSGRTTDIGVIGGLGGPLFVYSGANDVTDTLLLRQKAVQNRNAGRSSGYWRESSRKAPSNLYTDTSPHWASASGGAPPAQFAYRAAGVGSPGTPVAGLTVAFRSNNATWQWDGGMWLRNQGGSAHKTAWGDRVSAANVVVIETQRVGTGMVDASGATVPEFVFVGTGTATVFTDGMKVEGVWTRPTLSSVATLTTPEGAVIELTPGRTWIELIEGGTGILR